MAKRNQRGRQNRSNQQANTQQPQTSIDTILNSSGNKLETDISDKEEKAKLYEWRSKGLN